MTLSRRDRKKLAREAIRNAAATSDVPELDEDELFEMSLEQLDVYLKLHGVEVDWELIEAQVRGTLGEDLVVLERGTTVDRARMEEIEKRANAALTNASRSVTRTTVRQVTAWAMADADPRPEDERYLMWVTVEDDRLCPSCYDLHGTIDTADAWEGIGPGDGTTMCRDRCRCRLLPVAGRGRGEEGLRREEERGGLPERGPGR